MKIFLAVVSGFALTLSVFATGAMLAVTYLAVPALERGPGPDTASAWTMEPQRVNGDGDLERVEPRAIAATNAAERPAQAGNPIRFTQLPPPRKERGGGNPTLCAEPMHRNPAGLLLRNKPPPLRPRRF